MAQPQSKGMNVASSLLQNFLFPCAGFIAPCDADEYLGYQGSDHVREDITDTVKRQHSTSASAENVGDWYVEGATLGVEYMAVPRLSEPLLPLRIKVIVPDQVQWPADLWDELDARDSVHIRGLEQQSLGASKHLCKALRRWSSQFPDFANQYNSMPFASEIIVSNFDQDDGKMQIRFEPSDDFAALTMSSAQLQEMWKLDANEIPPVIELKELCFIQNLAENVALVTIASSEDPSKRYAFKSAAGRFAELYHEAKILLTTAPHDCVVPKPPYLITKYSDRLGTEQVLGFLLYYYPIGSLQDVLPLRRANNTLLFSQQLQWAKDVTSALVHIQSQPAAFFSDLRLDNIILQWNEAKQMETALLVDFEQGRNLYNWAPPEIYLTEWIAEMGHKNWARTRKLPTEVMARYAALLNRILSTRKYPLPLETTPEIYTNAKHGWYFPWVMTNRQEKEAGMVYLLGKALYCIFEAVANTDVLLGRSHVNEEAQQFPQFHRTPPHLQTLIRECTNGAREWYDDPIRICRRGGRIFPLGKSGQDGEKAATLSETKEAIRSFWQGEMLKAEDFVLARQRYDQGRASEEDVEKLHYLRRPSLEDVYRRLSATTDTGTISHL